MQDAITIENVSKSYGANTVLSSLSFSVHRNTVVGLVGENGAGKTTLMKAILGLVQIDEGSILINGYDHITQRKQYEGEVAFLLEPRYYSYLNAVDNLREILLLTGKYGESSKAKIEDTLDFFKLQAARKKNINGFSFGMKQRLGLAQALITDPSILILDEPFVGLDVQGISLFKEKIREIASCDATILLSSHQLNEIQDVCTDVAFLKNGQIVINDSMENLISAVSVFTFENPLDEIKQSLREISGEVSLSKDRKTLRIISNASDLFEVVAKIYSDNKLINVNKDQRGLEYLFTEVYQNNESD